MDEEVSQAAMKKIISQHWELQNTENLSDPPKCQVPQQLVKGESAWGEG